MCDYECQTSMAVQLCDWRLFLCRIVFRASMMWLKHTILHSHHSLHYFNSLFRYRTTSLPLAVVQSYTYV